MLDKPFLVSEKGIGSPDPLNMNKVVSFAKHEDDGIQSANKPGRNQIRFTRDENSVGPKEVFWKFESEADRDSEYDKIVCLVATPIT